ncbi:YidC/Oxa1 family membrane protein insertase [Eubacteriaceae bacterium ES3]|nr:YidC/Oxa1 family membrane protein insertase [Eubacteriaceae bacterium ES3]
MDFLYQIFGFLLLQLYNLIGNYGVSIIVFTIIVKLLLLPLNIKQTKSMKDMQRLQPELQKLNKKYKNNKEKLNEETLKLYKVYKVNPAAGCLPLLLQFPILIGLYGTLRAPETWVFSNGMIDSVNMSFLWIDNLNSPDPIYVLPILAALFTFISQKFTMANSSMNPDDPNAKTQKVMLYMMPIMIGYISIRLPAGVALYWVVQNIFTFVQQFVMMRIPEPEISPEEAERRVQEAEKERKADLAAKRSGMSQQDNQNDKPERKEPLTKPATKKKIKSNNRNESRKKPVSEIPERDDDKA